MLGLMKRAHILQLAVLTVFVVGGLVLTLRAPQQPADISAVTATEPQDLITGPWQSEQDPLYSLHFDPSGSITESYEGAQIARGTFFFADTPMGYTDAVETTPGDSFLLQDIDGERYAYRVLLLTPSRLELSYLERGNTLSFVRR
jgi:hypothetical protein